MTIALTHNTEYIVQITLIMTGLALTQLGSFIITYSIIQHKSHRRLRGLIPALLFGAIVALANFLVSLAGIRLGQIFSDTITILAVSSLVSGVVAANGEFLLIAHLKISGFALLVAGCTLLMLGYTIEML